ncbi:T9SS type B sorting domain-containing protein [Croceitalea sp. P059]|uniref:T9SS type B sorting domain-containing protein n=1 Tax=Croceitalea sp. P059 TaxID=3075601 RepID=UPI0028838CC2|nr:T9SS type B sorting domain-containing protein [Croceitalea sp. P059]MDT0539683.1 T9SS type B sorting domain-containing protein [Croceitalea sp. P059]
MKNKILFYIIFFYTVILSAQSNEDCWTLINNGIDIYNGQYNNTEFPGYHDPETTDLEEVTGGFLTTGQYNKQTFDSNDNNNYTNLEDKDGSFLTKHDYDGNLEWIVYTEKDVNSYRDVMFGSVEDSKGNLYVIGHSINGTFFDSEGTEIDFNNSNNSVFGGFIIKLDEDGKIVWHIIVDNVYSKRINIDEEDNILLSGDVNIYNNITHDFYLNGVITDKLSNFEIMGNNFNYVNRGVLKINPEGELLWYTGIKTSGPNSEFLIDIGSDNNNNIYVTGYCSFDAEVYSAGETDNPNIISWSGNPSKTFLIKFDKDGQFRWKVKSYINSSPNNDGVLAYSMAVDEQGNSYISGSNDSRSINSSDQVFENNDGSITSEHVGTFFLAKVNTNGICEWIKGAADSYTGTGYKVIKSNDEIIVVGTVRGFNILSEEVEFLSSDGNNIQASFYPNDYFLAIYDTDGNLNRVVSNGINDQEYFVSDRISGFFKDSNDNYYISRNIWFYSNGPQNYENFGHFLNAQSFNGREGTITKFNEDCGVVIGDVINQDMPNLSLCDNTSVGSDTDGLIIFDLTQNEDQLLINEPLSDYQISYYEDLGLTNQILNPEVFENTFQSETIYIDVIHSSDPSKSGQTSFVIEVFELPTVTPIVELRQCDDNTDGISLFNLEEVIGEITTNEINETITFHETLTDATLGDSPILNTTNYPNSTPSTDTIWARIVNGNDCIKTSQVNLIISTTEIPLTFTRDFYECDDDIAGTITDGISSFDFSTVTTEIEALFPVGQQLVITYYRNLADALSENNSITDITDYRNVGYPITQNIYIRVDSLLDNDCLGLGSHITLHVEEVPMANPITIPDECDDDGDGLFAFDSSNYESTIIGSQTNVNVIYIDQNGSVLPSPLPNPFITATQTITARVENALSQDADGSCYDETTISFSVDAAAVANPITDFIECDDDTDGKYPFDTSSIETTVLNGQNGMLVIYTDSNDNILPSPLPNPFLTGNDTITVRVENPLNTNCFDETSVEFIVRERPEFELIDEDVICINNSPTLVITTYNPDDVYTYNWTGPNGFIDTGASTTVSEGGIYSVIATSSIGCPSFEQEIIITESELASISLSDITIVDDSNNNMITISTANLGIGDYEFSIDEEFGIFQDEPVFNNVIAGIHTIYIRSKNDCGTTSIEVSVIGFPNFFTPNGDGVNDLWNVKGINDNSNGGSIIHIYDRFGKIVANINPFSTGWDGYYNGQKLPATDYWFTAQLKNSDGTFRIRKGHFSLIRK